MSSAIVSRVTALRELRKAIWSHVSFTARDKGIVTLTG